MTGPGPGLSSSGQIPPRMTDVDPAFRDRLDQLERDLRELRGRVAALERLVGTAGEHAADRSTVREKVSYDWQS